MSGRRLHLFFFFALNLLVGAEAIYRPFFEYSGSSFFDAWEFTNDWDRNNLGRVQWVDKQTAISQHLANISPSGNAIIRVDNTTVIPRGTVNPTRNTVRMVSNNTYDANNLIIIDVVHMPVGCSVWPAFWTFGTNWPNDGEIDIIEGVNTMTNNQYAVHTTQGCTIKSDGMSGLVINNNCTSYFGHNAGCTVSETQQNSFGTGFAAAGGGVWAVQLDLSGVFIWFWSRPKVPESIKSATKTSTIDVTTWGNPSAAYPNTSCNYAEHFKPQHLILSINICGDWANSSHSCPPPVPQLCSDIVTADPSAGYYNKAYWEIAYIRTYVKDTTTSGSSVSSGEPTAKGSTMTHQTSSSSSTLAASNTSSTSSISSSPTSPTSSTSSTTATGSSQKSNAQSGHHWNLPSIGFITAAALIHLL